jgi:hypothetical protein
MRVAAKLTVLSALLCLAGSAGVRAAGMETFGNAPLSDANYKNWPGIMPVINHESRVYSWWVNGNEQFFYHGDTEALNGALRRLAGAADLNADVILRPGPAATKTFQGDKTVAYDWSLHLLGGIAAHLATRDKGELVWSKRPVLTIYTGGRVDLEKLFIPPSLRVTRLSDLKKRVREGLTSRDKTVRGWGAGVLAELDPYDTDSVRAIESLLQDEDSWVRLNAAHALPTFGRLAQAALPALRANLGTEDTRLKEAVEQGIAAIEAAGDRSAAEKAHREELLRIEALLQRRKN